MMPQVIYLAEAADDVAEARTTYESRSVGLGNRFLDAVHRVVAQIEWNPRLYGEVVAGIRACPTKRFPFVVYYRVEPQGLIIIAVRHGRDDPAIWQRRG